MPPKRPPPPLATVAKPPKSVASITYTAEETWCTAVSTVAKRAFLLAHWKLFIVQMWVRVRESQRARMREATMEAKCESCSAAEWVVVARSVVSDPDESDWALLS